MLWAEEAYESSTLGRTNMADLPDASRAFEGQVLLCSILQDGMRQGGENLVQHTSLCDQAFARSTTTFKIQAEIQVSLRRDRACLRAGRLRFRARRTTLSLW